MSDDNELKFDRNSDSLDGDIFPDGVHEIYDRMVDELINGVVTTNTDVDDYQCPHDWKEVSIGEELCSECAVCHAVDC